MKKERPDLVIYLPDLSTSLESRPSARETSTTRHVVVVVVVVVVCASSTREGRVVVVVVVVVVGVALFKARVRVAVVNRIDDLYSSSSRSFDRRERRRRRRRPTTKMDAMESQQRVLPRTSTATTGTRGPRERTKTRGIHPP